MKLRRGDLDDAGELLLEALVAAVEVGDENRRAGALAATAVKPLSKRELEVVRLLAA